MQLFRSFLLTGLLTSVLAVPLEPATTVDIEDPRGTSSEEGLSFTSEYKSAWDEVLGEEAPNLSGDVVKVRRSAEDALDKRVIGAINGRSQYVALFHRNGRYVITLVFCAHLQGSLGDSLTSTRDVASAVATSARNYMGHNTGWWASTAWGFYTSIAYNTGYTIVAKCLMPRGMTEYSQALAAARALSIAYDLGDQVVWAYPQNNKKRSEGQSEVWVLSAFNPTVRLVDQLVQTFHQQEMGLASYNTTSDHPSTKTKRQRECFDSNQKRRILWSWVPWNTQFDIGCIGQLSDFDTW